MKYFIASVDGATATVTVSNSSFQNSEGGSAPKATLIKPLFLTTSDDELAAT